MSGHSKWATIKRKKAGIDAARGRVFTQVGKEITVAARVGGGNPDGNPRLRLAIDKAKSVNMPAENIKRAMQKGTGELPGVMYEEMMFEGYGAGGVAVLVESVTDNKNRTVAEIRHFFEKYGGKLGTAGSVARMFHRKGTITVPKKYTEDEIMAVVLDAGADDMLTDEEYYHVTTSPENFEPVKNALVARKIEIESAEVGMNPETTIKVEGKETKSVLKLMEALEEHEDVQNVYSNFDIEEKAMAEYNA
ncbi:MAG: YebC/PmpR family DNA-binding transcriptional regulator [Ignavibacteriales bacterium]|nr:YebC/PmpR family DNA-binding transcriptional regulator [Ignavibacteriales bacterium]